MEPVGTPDMPAPRCADPSLSIPRWLWEEAKFHLLPWGPKFRERHVLMITVSIGFAVTVTVAWVLSATGRIGPTMVSAWWIGWSVYEVVARMFCKPWIKEGPWWERHFRPASLPDIMAYVATKNLLIGAGLFAVLHAAGVLRLLRELPALRWLH